MLNLGVQFLPFRVVRFDRGGGPFLVQFGVFIPFDVVPRAAFLDLVGGVVPRHTQGRVAVLVEIGKGHVVIPVGRLFVPARDVSRVDVDRDADFFEVLLYRFGPTLPCLAVGQGQHAHGGAVIAHLGQQFLGLVGVMRVLRYVVSVEVGFGRHGAGGHGAETVPDHVFDELSVQRVHDRLTEAFVRGWPFAVVQPHPCVRREEFPAVRGRADAVHFGQTFHVPVFDSTTRQDRHFAGLEGHGARCRIGDHAVIQVFDVGQTIHVIVVVLGQVDIAALAPLDELVGAGADGRGVHFVGGVIGAFVDVRGHDGH